MYASTLCAYIACGGQKELDSLELDLRTAVRHHVGAGNRTPVLCEVILACLQLVAILLPQSPSAKITDLNHRACLWYLRLIFYYCFNLKWKAYNRKELHASAFCKLSRDRS